MRARGPIGENWWARRFVEGIDSFGDAGRLARGRSYVRGGAVEWIRVESGKVSGEVAGSGARLYRVAVHIAPLDEGRALRVIAGIVADGAEEAGRALADGGMPEGAEEAFRAVGTNLFPSLLEMEPLCSCPDHGFPCKHGAALLYTLADAIDGDPLLLLGWNGVSPSLLMEELESALGSRVRPRGELEVELVPLPQQAAEFWAPSEPLPFPAPVRPFTPLAHWESPIPVVAEALEPIYEAMGETVPEDEDRAVRPGTGRPGNEAGGGE